MERAAGVMVAAPKPWNARKEISDSSLHAKPQRSEPSIKTKDPTMKMRRRPSRSAERPPSNRNPPKTRAYALMTHWRFSCENPRSIWMDDSATFTIAMSRMTMNCGARMSAECEPFLVVHPVTSVGTPFRVCLVDERDRTESDFRFASTAFHFGSKPLESARDQELRPVLSGRPCPRPRRGAVVAARRPRTAPRGAALALGPQRSAHGLRNEHPRGPPEDARARRRRSPADGSSLLRRRGCTS